MNKYHIRFNHQHDGTSKVWRVFENGVEHLVGELLIKVNFRFKFSFRIFMLFFNLL